MCLLNCPCRCCLQRPDELEPFVLAGLAEIRTGLRSVKASDRIEK